MKTPDKVLSTSLDLAFSFVGLSQNNRTSENSIFNSKSKMVKLLKRKFRFRPEACKKRLSETLRRTGARYANIVNSLAHDYDEHLQFIIQPNPNDGSFSIRSESPVSTAEFLIYDGIGKLLVHQNEKFLDSIASFQITIPSGLYQLVIRTDNGYVTTKKFVVAK